MPLSPSLPRCCISGTSSAACKRQENTALRRRGNQKDLLRWVLFIFDGSHGFHSITSDWPRTVQASRRIASKNGAPNLIGTREAEMKNCTHACAREPAGAPSMPNLCPCVRACVKPAEVQPRRNAAKQVLNGEPAAPREPPIFRQTAQIVCAARSRRPSLVQGAQVRVGALRHPAQKSVRL